MSWFRRLLGGSDDGGAAADAARASALAAQARTAAWETALNTNSLPPAVMDRLSQAHAGTIPWISSMTPAELLLVRSHGLRPIATVMGTCFYHYGFSWTRGHAEGWRWALYRLQLEAAACGANAVVDVKMRTAHTGNSSMDYSLIGTAVRLEGLPANPNPVVATTSAIEFVRLLEAGVVPTGIAVGAHYEWYTDYSGNLSGNLFMGNQPLMGLGGFWESIRRQAHADLRQDAARHGNGVLAHTQFGEIFKQERERMPDQYLGRHIVIGTVVETRYGDPIPHGIRTVVDMRDELSPLIRIRPKSHNAYGSGESVDDLDDDSEEGI